MKTLLMFSGQGAQYQGMGLDLIALYPELETYIHMASDVLNKDMMKVFQNPESFHQTLDTQLMMVIVHKMYASYLSHKNIQVDGVLGFSLGEMSAWHSVNAIDYKALLLLTQARAIAMQHACEKSDGMMAAVLKLDQETVINTCHTLFEEDGYLIPVNFNAPLQTVISGHKKVYEKYAHRFSEIGGKLLPLQVAGAFHTPLMVTDLEIFSEVIHKTQFLNPDKALYLNVTGTLFEKSLNIGEYLLKQVVSPVKFTHMIDEAIKHGYDHFIEIGPGNVLTGLIKKVLPDASIITLSKPDQLEAI